jgi:phage terminase large subunit
VLWDGEEAMLLSVVSAIHNKKPLVVTSGHSLGKDFVAAGLVPYFLECFAPCIVITTAPTNRQVKNVMWAEIERHYKSLPDPPGELLNLTIQIAPKHYALGFTTKETAGAVGKFQGFHADRVFVIVSEAQAVPDEVYQQIDAILTGQIGFLMMIGNPLRTTGTFANAIRAKDQNQVIQMSCLDTPNYIEKAPIIPGVCSYEWVEDKRKRWGENDPRWISRVLGLLPSTSIDTIFPHELVEKMIDRKTLDANVRKGVAVDPAHFGDDESVIYGGTNGMIEASKIYTGEQTDATAAHCSVMLNRVGGNFIAGDTIGVGVGVFDTLRTMGIRSNGKPIHLIPIQSAAQDGVDQSYANRRAEMWFTALRRAERGDAAVPNDPVLIEELTEVKYFMNNKGKIQIEGKDDIKERLGRSPNRADAWVMFQYGMEQASPIHKERYRRDSSGTSGEISAASKGLGGMAA